MIQRDLPDGTYASYDEEVPPPVPAPDARARRVRGCGCECCSGGFCGGCGHAGCGRR